MSSKIQLRQFIPILVALAVAVSATRLLKPQLSQADSSAAGPVSSSSASSSSSGPVNFNAGGDPNPAYSKVEIRDGVYNGGQAALWDLPFLDYFAIFGPQQRARGYRPEQPVHFSHVTHVQKNQMECQYCHWTVAKSPYAAIPEVQACAGCHGMLIKGTTEQQKSEIAKLTKYWDEGKPVEWVKVHFMPDYIRFNHKRHVKGGVTCQECHGQIPKMEVVERVSTMKMGWCVSCHRERGTSIDCYTCHH